MKRFQVDERNVNYIHGDFSDAESIVFGHSKHLEIAFPELMEQKFTIELVEARAKG